MLFLISTMAKVFLQLVMGSDRVLIYLNVFLMKRHFHINNVHVQPEKLVIRKKGKSVRLEYKWMEVLVYLMENNHRIVTKEELHENIWRGSIVGDDSLHRIIYQLRRSFTKCDASLEIMTIKGIGYLLESRVTEGPGKRYLNLKDFSVSKAFASGMIVTVFIITLAIIVNCYLILE